MLHTKQGHALTLAVGELASVSLPVYDAEGNLWPVVSGTCASGAEAFATAVNDGIIAANIPPQTSVKRIRLTWTLSGSDTEAEPLEVTTFINVVASHLCSIQDIRRYNAGANVDNFEDASRYPSSLIFEARAIATEIIERACGVHFSKHWNSFEVLKPQPVVAFPDCMVSNATIKNGGAVDMLSDCQASVCKVSEYPVEIEYICGFDQTPEDVSAAVVKLAASILRPLNRPECATGESTELGYISYTLAGRDGATGIPDVDAAIMRYRRRRLG